MLGNAFVWIFGNDTAGLTNATLAAALFVLILIAVGIIRLMLSPTARIADFLSEGTDGKASVSRLQMLIWNFVVGFAFLFMLAKSGGNGIKELLNEQVLILLGISNGTYFFSKWATPKPADQGAAPAAARSGAPAPAPAAPAPAAPAPAAPAAPAPAAPAGAAAQPAVQAGGAGAGQG